MNTEKSVELPVKRTTGEALKDRMTENAYERILPARYLRQDENGEIVESQEELFERVAKNVALAEAVYAAESEGEAVLVEPSDVKPGHSNRDELVEEVFGEGVTLEDDVKIELTEENVSKFAYDTVVPKLDGAVRDAVVERHEEFQEAMERLSFIPNSPTLMNAGDELQQLSACFVDSPEDDMQDIHETAKEAAEVFQCLTDDARVRVQGKGVVSVADVEPGDRIVQRDGDRHTKRNVEEVHAYDDAPVRHLVTEAGIEITGTPNHELLVDGEWTRIDETEAGDSLALRLGWLDDAAEVELEKVETGALWGENRTVSNEDIAELHSEGLSDYEIAEVLDTSSSTVQRRRSIELGLDPNGSGGRKGGDVSFDFDEFERLHDDGRTDTEIADELGVSTRAVARYREQRSLGSNGRAVKTVGQPELLTPELAELVGMWVGDGSKHQDGIRFHLAREETLEHADRLCRELFDEGLDWRWEDGCYDAVLHSHEIRRWWLVNFGEAKPDATEARVPDAVKRAGRETVAAFLRGLFSTDGGLQKNLYPRLCSSSEELIDGVQNLLLGIGVPATRWVYDTEERDYYNVGPTGERGLERFIEHVGFVGSRAETMRDEFESVESEGPSVGSIEGATWEVPVEKVEDAGTDTVYDVTVAEEPEYVANSVVSHNSGGGMGYAFWKLRPYGDPVGSTGGIASGPITFMRTFDQMCETIAQGGTRRGAQMGVMRVSHPDVIQFIHAKNKDVSLAHSLRLNDPDDYTHTSFTEALDEARELIDDEGRVPKHLRNAAEGHLSNFNISVGVSHEFMEALENDEEFTFTNPRTGEPHIATQETKELYDRFDLGEHVEVGEELSIPADEIWTRMVEGAYENGEPGVIYLDRVNDEHSFDVEEYSEHEILATNPCGEQPLEEYEACNLGHINLSTLVAGDAPDWRDWYGANADDYTTLEDAVGAFLKEAIDWNEFDRRIDVGTRFLENVVTMSDFPIDEIEKKVAEMRKIGLGIMGLAQMYVQVGIRYGSDEANEVARQMMRHINHESKRTSHELARERGVFDEWHKSKYANPVEYRDWFEKQTGESADDWEDGYPVRNHNTTTIAPTGTTSMLGNTTGGCEPIYNVAYYKNVSDDVQGDEMLVEFDDYFLRVLEANEIDIDAVKEEAEKQMSANEFDGVDGLETVPDAIGELFVTTGDLSAKEHASVQCACQEGVDSAISKTTNAPHDSTVEDAKEVFEYIYRNGGKGVTYYRDGTRSKQVLTTRADNKESSDDIDPVEEVRGMLEEGEITVDELTEGVTGVDASDADTAEVEAKASVESNGTPDSASAETNGSSELPTRGDEFAPRPRPDTITGATQKVETGYGGLYVTINEDDSGMFEVFARIGKSGGYTASFTEAIARLTSLCLRSGIPPKQVVEQLEGIRSPKVTFDRGEQVHSVPDAMAKAMTRYMEGETRPQQARLPLTEEEEDEKQAESDGGTATASTTSTAAQEPETEAGTSDVQQIIDEGRNPECPECGSMLVYTEGCVKCNDCGFSEC